MIKIIDGDLFTSKAKFICHQVNCKGKMGSGVALQVKKRFPHVFEEYKKVCCANMFGEVQTVPISEKYIGQSSGSVLFPYEEQYICNLFSQNNYGYDGCAYTSLDALEKCFNTLRCKTLEKNNNFGAVIAMPYKIGCVRGGADWNIVESMIKEIFKKCEVELWRLDNG